jgi:hypothetical protein
MCVVQKTGRALGELCIEETVEAGLNHRVETVEAGLNHRVETVEAGLNHRSKYIVSVHTEACCKLYLPLVQSMTV